MNPTRYCISAFDGGGTLGYIAARLAARLEEDLGCLWREVFALSAGTSTGAILAAAAAIGLPMAKAAEFYRKHATKLFPPIWTTLPRRFLRLFRDGFSQPVYSEALLEKLLQQVIGPVRLGELQYPFVATGVDFVSKEVVFFSSDDPAQRDLTLWHVVRCSAAAPGYFEGERIRIDGADAVLFDGGLARNSPSDVAKAFAKRRFNCTDRDLVLVSIGTGCSYSRTPPAKLMRRGFIEHAGVIMDTIHYNAAATRRLVQMEVPDFLVFNPQIPPELDSMTLAGAEHFDALDQILKRYCNSFEYSAQLERLQDRRRSLPLLPAPGGEGNP